MVGHLDDEQTAAATIDDEWVRTGDVGFVNDTGAVRLRRRAHNMYISGGYNVYPDEIQDLLTSYPAVQLAMVIGVEHETWAETGHAFLLLCHPHNNNIYNRLRSHWITRVILTGV